MSTITATTEMNTTVDAIVSSLASRGITTTVEYNGPSAMVKDADGRYAMVSGAAWPYGATSVKFGHIPAGEHTSLNAADFNYDAKHLGHSAGVRLSAMGA